MRRRPEPPQKLHGKSLVSCRNMYRLVLSVPRLTPGPRGECGGSACRSFSRPRWATARGPSRPGRKMRLYHTYHLINENEILSIFLFFLRKRYCRENNTNSFCEARRLGVAQARPLLLTADLQGKLLVRVQLAHSVFPLVWGRIYHPMGKVCAMHLVDAEV